MEHTQAMSVSNSYLSYANRCAIEPINDISNELDIDPSYIIAYKSGKSYYSVDAPTRHTSNTGKLIHRQGIQRLRTTTNNYFIVSTSTEKGSYTGIQYAGIEIINMGTRANYTEALTSGGVTTTSSPNTQDNIVKYLYLSSDHLRHAGGIQVMGHYAVVPFEDEDDGYTARFRIANLSDPENASWQHSSVTRKKGNSSEQKNAGAAALTRLNNGHYMVMIFGNSSEEVEVFVSSNTTMPTSSYSWNSVHQENTPFGNASYQNVQFVTDCTGKLYVLGTHNSDDVHDWADLWRVTFSEDGTYNPYFGVDDVSHRSPRCRSNNTDNIYYCSFKAGAGVYINVWGRSICLWSRTP